MTIHCKKVLDILIKTICKFMFQTTEKALTYQIGELNSMIAESKNV